MTSKVLKIVRERLDGLDTPLPPSREQVVSLAKGPYEALMQAFKKVKEYQTIGAGTTYFVRCDKFVKIGYTEESTNRRVDSFMTGSPYDFEILLEIPSSHKLERALHAIFRPYRHRREWFNLVPEIEEFIVKVRERLARGFRSSNGNFIAEICQEAERVSILKELQ